MADTRVEALPEECLSHGISSTPACKEDLFCKLSLPIGEGKKKLYMAGTKVDALTEECLSHVISFTSPRDACQSAAVSTAFHAAADSDFTWEGFLPWDYREIISRLVSPVGFSSKKELFRRLSCAPLLIDGGKKTFSIDKHTNKKCYMFCARELSITWSNHSLYWSWKSLMQSRFFEVVELIMTCWLEIYGKMNTAMLSPNTTYGAYLVIQVSKRAFGLDVVPFEVSIEAGSYSSRTRGTIYLDHDERGLMDTFVRSREDGWLEVELGEFYNKGNLKEVKMWFREVEGVHLKGGLIVEGIELRPKS